MRAKSGIDMTAATLPRRFGEALALRLGFTSQEYYLLWWLACNADHVKSNFAVERKTMLLDIIGRRPKEAARLVLAIRRNENRKKDQVIRRVLLDFRADPPNWTLPDKVVADMVCQKINTKLKGQALHRLVENVKKTRQSLAKKFPSSKGKIPAR